MSKSVNRSAAGSGATGDTRHRGRSVSRTVVGALVAALVSLLGLVFVLASPATAHHSEINGTAVCASTPGQIAIDYTAKTWGTGTAWQYQIAEGDLTGAPVDGGGNQYAGHVRLEAKTSGGTFQPVRDDIEFTPANGGVVTGSVEFAESDFPVVLRVLDSGHWKNGAVADSERETTVTAPYQGCDPCAGDSVAPDCEPCDPYGDLGPDCEPCDAVGDLGADCDPCDAVGDLGADCAPCDSVGDLGADCEPCDSVGDLGADCEPCDAVGDLGADCAPCDAVGDLGADCAPCDAVGDLGADCEPCDSVGDLGADCEPCDAVGDLGADCEPCDAVGDLGADCDPCDEIGDIAASCVLSDVECSEGSTLIDGDGDGIGETCVIDEVKVVDVQDDTEVLPASVTRTPVEPTATISQNVLARTGAGSMAMVTVAAAILLLGAGFVILSKELQD